MVATAVLSLRAPNEEGLGRRVNRKFGGSCPVLRGGLESSHLRAQSYGLNDAQMSTPVRKRTFSTIKG